MKELFIILISLLSLSIFIVPKKMQYFLMLISQIILMLFSGYFAFLAFNGNQTIQIKLFSILGNDVNIIADSLSAFFIFVINLTVFTGSLYAYGYLKPYRDVKTKTEMAWHYFNFLLLHISMLMVVVLREGISFLFFWELMSVSTFFLILFDSESQENKKAGIKFLIQMHIAFFILIATFLIISLKTNQSIGFDSLTAYFNTFPVFPLFLMFFIGFGIKAGFIPLHTWLPHAHPAAPSHISGVMSGVMIKMGIYGILRVITYIHTNLLSIGVLILIISIYSGIIGVIIAIVQHDFKKLLAYHSIENIGIIGIGIGFGVIGIAVNNPILACLGFAGGLLHILNHSLFKSLLFYSAGSVYQQTHTRNIEQLGGLGKKMPATALFFLIGAAAISGLPPFNGFISEFLIYGGLFKSLSNNNFIFTFTLLSGIIALVIIGGLAVFCFTKVFSIIFLGNARSKDTEKASEVKKIMLLPKLIITLVIVFIGFFPFLILKPLSILTGTFIENTSFLFNIEGIMTNISITVGILVVLIAILWFIKKQFYKKQSKTIETTWGCGYTGANPAVHQYTATSYANYIVRKAKYIVGVKKHFKPIEKDDIFPEKTEFETHSSDVFEEKTILKPVNKILNFLEKIAVFQTGNIQHYLLYALFFIFLISILTILKII